VYDLGQAEDGTLYLTMERLTGASLDDLLNDREDAGKTLSQAEAISVALPILDGLGVAHRAGLVHRDLKPGNIFLAQEESQIVPKILDFGIAHTAGSALTAASGSLGTPNYMSPEQCGNLPVDGRSDLYSLGVLLFRCVTGRLPFVAAAALETMKLHRSLEPAPDVALFAPQPLSESFRRCVAKALAKRPVDRFQNVADMAAMLRACRRETVADTQITDFPDDLPDAVPGRQDERPRAPSAKTLPSKDTR